MRKSLLAASVSIAALGLSSSGPTSAQSDADQQLGNVHFKTSCNEVAQRRFDRAMRYQHSFWYLAAKEIFEEAAQGRPDLRHGALGHRAYAAGQSAQRDPAPNLPPGLAAIQKAKAIGAKTERERDYIDALMLMYADYDKLSHTQRIRAFRDAMEKVAAKYPNDDEAQIAYAITLNTSARPERQDLCPADQGRRDPGADLKAAAAASGRHALPDPSLRLSGDRREGPRCRQPLRQDRAGRAARPAHAVAHLHPRRLLEGVDRLQHRLGEGRQGREVGRQPAARPGLHGLCPSAARPGQAGARRHRRDDEGDRFQSDRRGRRLCAGGFAGALCGRARRLERRVATVGPAEHLQLRRWRSRTSPARSAPRAPASRTPPRPTSPSSPSCATSCARPRTPIGRRSSTSSGRSRRLGAQRRGQIRRGAQGHERGGRRRGQDRESRR